MRKEHSHQSEMVSQLLYGDCFKIISTKKEWVQISALEDEYTGWIDQKQFKSIAQKDAVDLTKKNALYTTQLVDYIENQDQSLSAVVLGSNMGGTGFLNQNYKGNCTQGIKEKAALVKTAYLYMNAPYLWGGKTPMGIDCSGLTQMTYRINGLSIPRDASLQAQLGETLSFIDESEAGDLAFFDDAEGKIIHVGLLLENHYILHAHGKVRIDRIDQTGIYNTETQQHSHKLRIIKKLV